jgi:hypothetical protein
MDELIKELQKKYIENLTSSLEFHHFFIFGTFIMSLMKFLENKKGSIWLELINSKLKDILDTTNGPFSKITILYILISVLLTFISGALYGKLKFKVFIFLASKRDFNVYVEDIIERSRSGISESQSLNLYLADDQHKKIETRRKYLSRIHAISEILASFVLISIAGTLKSNYLDLFFGILFLLLILFLQNKSFEYYVSKVVPLLVIESLLRDKQFTFSEGFEEQVQS